MSINSQKIKHIRKLAATNILIFIVLLLVVEGGSSLLLFFYELPQTSGLKMAERLHTRYDSDLGWVNIPGKNVPDMYGAGKNVRINSQGFRNNTDIAATIPQGKVRMICSGDSFTFGYGVDNDEAWCSLLGRRNGIETVNMGQGGYGPDQAYLWYLKDGKRLQHNIQIFAVVAPDLVRMLDNNLLGYGKPVFAIENDRLVTKNVPVPRAPYLFSWFTRNNASIKQLRVLQLYNTIFPSGGSNAPQRNESIDAALNIYCADSSEGVTRLSAGGGSLNLVPAQPTDGSRLVKISPANPQINFANGIKLLRETAAQLEFVITDANEAVVLKLTVPK